jgi:DEAD/DEAH box helicase domain-containing protein
VYPTKALSRDQEESLKEIYESLDLKLDVGVYDGDTTKDRKKELREDADVVLTNFQGLNYYLPHHSSWENFFSDLGLVVIDEAHMYTGVMGTHASWITRRLLRLVEEKHNATPQIVVTTATLGNPREHTETLTGKVMEVIETDYSPREKQDVVLWNPERKGHSRVSPHRSVTKLAPWLVDNAGSQILIFTPSRRTTELCMKWIQENSSNYSSDITVDSYHAGHSKESRRNTEDRVKSGDIDIVVSTTALEVGINIGDLDVVISDTYPGSRMSFWQQIGRAGRENTESTTFFVADKTSTDQYIIDNPSYLLSDDVEDAIIDLTNKHISSKHITVAAAESPLLEGESKYFTGEMGSMVNKLRKRGILEGDLESGITFEGSYRPEAKISLYSTSSSGFSVKIIENGKTVSTLPEVSRSRAYRELFSGATYLHKGVKYQVEEFVEEESKKEIHLTEADDINYYTRSDKQKKITNIKSEDSKEIGHGVTVHKGQIIVKERYPSYTKIYESRKENVTGIPTGLDESLDLKTEACWITFESDISEQIADRTTGNLLSALHGAEHSMIELSPMILNVDSQDIGGLSTRHHNQTHMPTIFIYDGINGGIGYSYKIYETLQSVSGVASNRISRCDCSESSGCLECIMSTNCGSQNESLHKKGSAMVTRILSELV